MDFQSEKSFRKLRVRAFQPLPKYFVSQTCHGSYHGLMSWFNHENEPRHEPQQVQGSRYFVVFGWGVQPNPGNRGLWLHCRHTSCQKHVTKPQTHLPRKSCSQTTSTPSTIGMHPDHRHTSHQRYAARPQAHLPPEACSQTTGTRGMQPDDKHTSHQRHAA